MPPDGNEFLSLGIISPSGNEFLSSDTFSLTSPRNSTKLKASFTRFQQVLTGSDCLQKETSCRTVRCISRLEKNLLCSAETRISSESNFIAGQWDTFPGLRKISCSRLSLDCLQKETLCGSVSCISGLKKNDLNRGCKKSK